ncbi:MAG: hypothetical protein MJ054_01385 [Clostridia bacterium]|nr:hypothetical protein [Clostridia bacterium]
MTEQDLSKKILHRATQHAKELISSAEQHAEQQISDAKKQAEVRKAKALSDGQASLAYRQVQQENAYEVAKIKAKINAQQAWVDRAFSAARQKLLNASVEEIKTIVETYIQKYAQPNDKISIATNWSQALPNLPTTTAIQSGIIIENDIYRIELDIDGILHELKDEISPAVAEILGVL